MQSLQTARLHLRPLVLDDAAFIYLNWLKLHG